MNTPAHVIANLLVLSRRGRPSEVLPITLGSLLPDVPMFLFYAWEKLVRHLPEMTIWSERYHDPRWQTFFDLFHALPLILLGMLVARLAGSPRWLVFFASMGLHALADLPLHREDAHRHFWPLTDWRFVSPVSYWQPSHYGRWVSLGEILLILAGSAILWRRHPQRWVRALAAAIAGLYLGLIGYTVWVWM